MFKFRFITMIAILCFSQISFAKRFTSNFAEFELPPGWECILEGTEYVCQSENADRKKEAIIILAAKKKGPQDTLGEYKKYLSMSRTYALPGSKKQVSEPKSVNETSINNHKWIDALHLASEVPGFYTRYLATVKAGIGVAVTFSVTKSMYDAYKGVFDKVIQSMRVFAQENTNLSGLRIKSKEAGEGFDDPTFVDPDSEASLNIPTVKKDAADSDSTSDDFLFLVIFGVVGLLIVLKLKGNKKKSSKKKKK